MQYPPQPLRAPEFCTCKHCRNLSHTTHKLSACTQLSASLIILGDTPEKHQVLGQVADGDDYGHLPVESVAVTEVCPVRQAAELLQRTLGLKPLELVAIFSPAHSAKTFLFSGGDAFVPPNDGGPLLRMMFSRTSPMAVQGTPLGNAILQLTTARTIYVNTLSMSARAAPVRRDPFEGLVERIPPRPLPRTTLPPPVRPLTSPATLPPPVLPPRHPLAVTAALPPPRHPATAPVTLPPPVDHVPNRPQSTFVPTMPPFITPAVRPAIRQTVSAVPQRTLFVNSRLDNVDVMPPFVRIARQAPESDLYANEPDEVVPPALSTPTCPKFWNTVTPQHALLSHDRQTEEDFAIACALQQYEDSRAV